MGHHLLQINNGQPSLALRDFDLDLWIYEERDLCVCIQRERKRKLCVYIQKEIGICVCLHPEREKKKLRAGSIWEET